MAFWPARLRIHKPVRLAVQNEQGVLFGKMKMILRLQPFVTEC